MDKNNDASFSKKFIYDKQQGEYVFQLEKRSAAGGGSFGYCSCCSS